VAEIERYCTERTKEGGGRREREREREREGEREREREYKLQSGTGNDFSSLLLSLCCCGLNILLSEYDLGFVI
jgi:hypothetical protein